MTVPSTRCVYCQGEVYLRTDGTAPGHVDPSKPVELPRRERACPGSYLPPASEHRRATS